MTSRDERASYYDLELPDGTRTEVWAVLRAVLTPEEAVGYTKGCLLTRIMRDGRKDVDRLREAEKVGIEAGMLREAMAAHLSSVDAVADRECERQAAVATAEELERARKELSDLRETYDAEMEFRAEMRRELGARDGEGFPDFLRRICRELAALRDRYRPRRQSEEPAPRGAVVMRWNDTRANWYPIAGINVGELDIWTHQPPAPGKGE